jgi:hypothetical protein
MGSWSRSARIQVETRNNRMRGIRSPSAPANHDRATYGAIRAAPTVPSQKSLCVFDQTTTSRAGHGTAIATKAQPCARINLWTGARLVGCTTGHRRGHTYCTGRGHGALDR